MQDKIVRLLMDKMRDALPPDRAYGRVLQALAWVSMDTRRVLPPSATLDEVGKASPSEFIEIVYQLATHEPNWDAFDDLNDASAQDLHAFQGVVLKCRELREQGVLGRMSPADYLDVRPDLRIAEPKIPAVIADLMVRLLPQYDEQPEAYVAWDDTAQLTARLLDHHYRVFSQPRISALTNLAALISGRPLKAVNQGDPIAAPAFVEQGRLRKFVSALAYPPMGVRYPAEQIDHDLWGRFYETSTNGTVVALQHLLATAENSVVACVPNSFLFGTKVERALRERLLSQGCVKAVVAITAGAVSVAVLILSPKGGLTSVRMLDADHEYFRTGSATGNPHAPSVEAIASAIHRGIEDGALLSDPSAFFRDVPREEIAEGGNQLLVSHYLYSGKLARLKAAMRGRKTVRLGDIAEIFRPQVVKAREDQDSWQVREVGTSDFQAFGHIDQPSRIIRLDDAIYRKLESQHLIGNDIVLTIKGGIGKLGRVTYEMYEYENEHPWIAGQSFAVIRIKENEQRVQPEALFMLLRSELGQALIESIAVPGTIPFIQTSALEALQIPLPSAEEAKQAVALVGEEEAKQREVRALTMKSKMLWPL